MKPRLSFLLAQNRSRIAASPDDSTIRMAKKASSARAANRKRLMVSIIKNRPTCRAKVAAPFRTADIRLVSGARFICSHLEASGDIDKNEAALKRLKSVYASKSATFGLDTVRCASSLVCSHARPLKERYRGKTAADNNQFA